MAKRNPHGHALRDIEEAWEQWPGRKVPGDSTNIYEFFNWARDERRDLLEYREFGDSMWQEIKYHLLGYEARKGRSRSVEFNPEGRSQRED